jgi:hypothetical protein
VLDFLRNDFWSELPFNGCHSDHVVWHRVQVYESSEYIACMANVVREVSRDLKLLEKLSCKE